MTTGPHRLGAQHAAPQAAEPLALHRHRHR
jgi:hypothetical protein